MFENLLGGIPANLRGTALPGGPAGRERRARPLFWWVLPEDGKVLVSFDDARMVTRRIETAAGVYCLSPGARSPETSASSSSGR